MLSVKIDKKIYSLAKRIIEKTARGQLEHSTEANILKWYMRVWRFVRFTIMFGSWYFIIFYLLPKTFKYDDLKIIKLLLFTILCEVFMFRYESEEKNI